jgi:hypothetical protein
MTKIVKTIINIINKIHTNIGQFNLSVEQQFDDLQQFDC